MIAMKALIFDNASQFTYGFSTVFLGNFSQVYQSFLRHSLYLTLSPSEVKIYPEALIFLSVNF